MENKLLLFILMWFIWLVIFWFDSYNDIEYLSTYKKYELLNINK